MGGGPENTRSLLELIADIEDLTARKLETVFEPSRPGDQLVYVTDFRKLQRHIGWAPQHSPRETLQQIHEWWKRNRQVFLRPVAADATRVSALLQQLPRTA